MSVKIRTILKNSYKINKKNDFNSQIFFYFGFFLSLSACTPNSNLSMKNFKLINNLFGWLTFVIAAITYLLTIEPTASFWDCGEFISTAYKLDVGHPPGAPFFMLIGRFFANFASDPTLVAKMINSMSALFSALTILFLFWTITRLARKIVQKNSKQMTAAEAITIIGSGLVGALAYTFSDTFWFSAVEGEVYAFSSLFTAVVFWAMLKWEEVSEHPNGDRWIIFIAYLMGLSIGVHLLNLLCIPALVLIYYFKKSKKVSAKGALLALAASVGLIAVVLYGIVPGFVNMAGWFDLFFVNILGFHFNTGAVVYVVFMAALLIWGLYETFVGKSILRMKIAFCANIIMVGIPFIGSSIFVWILLCAGVIALAYFWKGLDPRIMNTVLLSLMVMVIGYSSYGVTVIRSSAKPPMDQNSPNNMFSLKSYLNREQYGETPLIYGETFASDIEWKAEGQNCVPVYKKGAPLWFPKAKKDASEKDVYEMKGYKNIPVMNSETSMFFPRMYSKRADHVEAYKMWSNFKGQRVSVNKCGQIETVLKPTMAENMKYFFSYQVNFMYWRYFMWNFAGRQNDIQSNGEIYNGNWITGINFVDKLLVGDQTTLSSEMLNNKGRNRYYLLPLILGIVGIFFQSMRGEKGIQGFWITFFLFFMTGLAIVLYLNQSPLQPRERDYAYAGSFYAFTIWIGLGVAGLVHFLKKYIGEKPAAIAVSVLCLGIPTLMASENWNDHDRSNRYTTRDFAKNYLESCDKDAVIFTNGDNDTFPLWYVQEVEGFRTDVRVCNLSYFQTDWYAAQMSRPYYDSPALPISWTYDMYFNGNRDYARIVKLTDDSISLNDAMSWVETDDSKYKKIPGYGENVDYIPSNKVYLDVDKNQVIKNNYVDAKYHESIVNRINFDFSNKQYLGKQELLILNMLLHNNWVRPLYFAVTVEESQFLGMSPNFIQEGLAYKVTPTRSSTGYPQLNTDKMYDMMVNKFKYGNIQDKNVYLDETVLRMCRTLRAMFVRLMQGLYDENKLDKAEMAADFCEKMIPMETVSANYNNIDIAELYYKLGKASKAGPVMDECAKSCLENLNWTSSLNTSEYRSAINLVSANLYTLQKMLEVVQKYDNPRYEKIMPFFQSHAARFQQLNASNGSRAN